MGKYQLIEYRPNRWIKVDPQTGVIGPPTPQEVAAWQSAQQVQGAESVAAEKADTPLAPGAGQPTAPEPVAPDPPSEASEGATRGAPQKPGPKPKPVEPTKPEGQGPVRPLAGRRRVTSTFADHLSRTPPSTAPGIDFACAVGTEVRAWAAGRVIRSRWSDGGGRSLWILHDNAIRTYYAHLSSVSALEGETVAVGQKIAESGNTGHTTGPHLHFSVVRNGKYVNPDKYLPAEESGVA
jgi:murein DD-endopeptidase MepM/ murein hydrolase activator NlpD